MTIIELLAKDVINIRKKSNTNGGEYSSSCPVCGGEDRFISWPEQNNNGGRWWCRGCGRGGDCIQYLRDVRNLSYPDACKYLGQEPGEYNPSLPRESYKHEWAPKQYETPVELWRKKGASLITWAQEQLLNNPDTISYLEKRGISLQTIGDYRLGWNDGDKWRERPAWGLPDGKICISKGIVIPYYRDGILQRIRIRTGSIPPYKLIAGSNSNSMILNADRKVFIIVESELDAMLLWQESKHLVSVISLGNAQTRPDYYAEKLLREADLILVSLDSDKAGANEAWKWWPDNFSQAQRWPAIQGKDQGEMWQSGINLSEWISAGINHYA